MSATLPQRVLRHVPREPVWRLRRRIDRFRNPRAEMLFLAMQFVARSRVEGDYLEFGVWQGDTFASAVATSRHDPRLDGMRFHAFDSFEGLPAPEGKDAEGFAHFREGQYAVPRDTFERTLKKAHVDTSRVTVTEGWFDTTLTVDTREELALERAAVVWVDCDLYESTVPVLPFIRPLLQDGTVLIFDDWYCFRADPAKGEQRAVAEWLEREPSVRLIEYRNFGWAGKAFVVNLR